MFSSVDVKTRTFMFTVSYLYLGSNTPLVQQDRLGLAHEAEKLEQQSRALSGSETGWGRQWQAVSRQGR